MIVGNLKNNGRREAKITFSLPWQFPIALCAFMALIGLLPMPYEWYGASRALYCQVFFACAWLLFQAAADRWLLAICLGGVVLYNPVITLHLGEKGVWFVCNVLSVILAYLSIKSVLGKAGLDSELHASVDKLRELVSVIFTWAKRFLIIALAVALVVVAVIFNTK